MKLLHRGGTGFALLATLTLLAGCGGVRPEPGVGETAVAPVQAAVEPATEAPASAEAVEVKPLPGYLAADIRATDVASGEVVSLADLKGQAVFLNFWATWCPPCKEEMPDMEELQQEMGEQVRILAIGADGRESPEKMAAFAEEMGLSFSVVHDGGSAARAYQVRGIPTSFFIDPEGLIQVRYTGQLSLDQMKEYAEQVSKVREDL